MLELQRVSKYYFSGNNVVQALRRINLKMSVGEFIAITGESGSGKSTLLNVLSGLDTYEEGKIFFNQEDISHYTIEALEHYRKDYIGYVFQEYNILSSYTVYQNIELALTIQGYPKEEIHQRVLELIDQVGLNHVMHQKASKLSGGEKQRTVIARTLAKDYSILVCDEPTGNLNEEASAGIFSLLKDISKDKLVIVVSHDIELLQHFATRKIRLYDGEIMEDALIGEQGPALDQPFEAKQSNTSLYGAMSIGVKNIRSVPKKSMFLFLTLGFILAAVFFVYSAGILEKNAPFIASNDDFTNTDPSRIILINEDKSKFQATDYQLIESLDYVRGTFNNDAVFDSVFISRYHDQDAQYAFASFKPLPALALESYQLEAGRLPESGQEVVVGNHAHLNIGDIIELANSHLLISSQATETNQYLFEVVGLIDEEETPEDGLHKLYLNNDGLARLAKSTIQENAQIEIRIEGTEVFNMSENRWIPTSEDANVDVGVRVYALPYPTWISIDESLPDDTLLTFDWMYFEICRNFGYKKQVRDDMEAGLCDGQAFIDSHDITYRAMTAFENHPDFMPMDLVSLRLPALDSTMKLYMNEATFNRYFDESDYQITVIVKDAYDGNRVVTELEDLGYNVFYPSQVMTSQQASDIVTHNLVVTLIVYAIIFAIFFGAYFILRNIIFSKLNDYLIFRSIGTSKKTIKQILRVEVFSITLVIMVLLAIFIVVAEYRIYAIPAVLRYFKWHDYLLVLMMIFAVLELMTVRFTKQIFSASVVTALKGVER